jgi:hypothetical protein
MMAKEQLTGGRTHIATQRGYGARELVEEGEFGPAGVPVSDSWMKKVSAKEAALLGAEQEATDLKPKDVDLEPLSLAALQAMAAERGINVEQKGKALGKDDLIAAIKAARATDAG